MIDIFPHKRTKKHPVTVLFTNQLPVIIALFFFYSLTVL